MRLQLFGGLRGFRSGIELDLGRPRQRFVLAILALERDRVVAADRLIELMWPDDPDKKLASLRANVSNLRRIFAEDTAGQSAPEILRQPPGYRLVMPRADIDTCRFEDLVTDGRRLHEAGDSAEALDAFTAALALWVGPLLPEIANEPIVLRAHQRWHRLLGSSVEAIAEIHLAAGDPRAALLVVEPWMDEFPEREGLAASTALALYRAGRQVEALRRIDEVRQTLVEQSGIGLGEELVVLEGRILAQDPSLHILQPGPAVPIRPAVPTPRIGSARRSSFIGRGAELAELEGGLVAAGSGDGSVVTVGGPSGIGKTALVERAAELAADLGMQVAWARCPAGHGVPPFWALLQIEEQLGLVVNGEHADPFVHARMVVGALRTLERPALVVIDDLQFADADTLRVLVHVLGELWRTPVAMVTTVQTPVADPSDDLVSCLAEIARLRRADLVVGPFDEGDVGAWLALRIGREVSGSVVRELHERTGGNPLFVREIGEAVGRVAGHDDAWSAALGSVPPGLVSIVRRRVGRLEPATQHAVSMAAVLGDPLDVDVLGDVLGITAEETLRRLDHATDHGIVTRDERARGFRFAHRIIAEALSSEVSESRRAEAHAAAARAVARRHPDDEHSARVAHHALAGAAAGTAALALDASVRAGHHAGSRGAFGEAARHWANAAEMMERQRPGDVRGRLEILIAGARAHERADEMREAQQIVVVALGLARSLGDVELIGSVAAVLGHASIFPNQPYGVVDDELIRLLEDCLAALPREPNASRATVLGVLGTELCHSADAAWRDAVSAEAVAVARVVGDPGVLARALHARTFALKSPLAVPERRAVAEELHELVRGASLGDDLRLVAELQIALADYALGHIDAAVNGVARCLGLVDRPVGQALRSQVGFFRALLEIVRGHYDAADEHAEAAFEVFRRSRPAEAAVFRFGQQLTIGHDLGDIPDGIFELVAAGRIDHFALVLRLYAAVILFDRGRRDQAIAILPNGPGAPDRPDDYTAVFIDTAAAMIAAEMGDRASAAVLLDRLVPMAGRWAGAGTAAGSLGLVDLAIARLHAMLGNDRDADVWFRSALDGHERAAAPAWLARSLVHHARHLRATDRVAESVAALDRAGDIAARLRLVIVDQQIRTARADT